MIIEKQFNRTQRVAKEIQKEIAIIFNQEIKDPRIKMATVSGVDVSRDLAYAKVFITFLNIFTQEDTIDKIKEIIKSLNGDMGKHVRFLLCKSMCLRIIPKLTFCYDKSLVEGICMAKLVSSVILNDERRKNISK